MLQVTSMTPQPGTQLAEPPSEITLTFNRAVGPDSLLMQHLRLEGSGGDGTFGEGNETLIRPTDLRFVSDTQVALDLTGLTLPSDQYRLHFGENQRHMSLAFDGIDDQVSTPLNIDQGPGSPGVTFEAWVNPSSPGNGRRHVIGTDNSGYDWSILRENDQWHVFTGEQSRSTGFAVEEGSWQHLAAVFEPDRGVTFYMDGRESFLPYIDYDVSDSNVAIGRNPTYPEFFAGTIDEVRVWNGTRTAAEIRANMHEPLSGTETGLLAYWKLDDGAGQSAVDSSVDGQHGVLGGNATVGPDDPWWWSELYWPEGLDGSMLDGEFTGIFPSGNGTAGGEFVAEFEILDWIVATPDPIVRPNLLTVTTWVSDPDGEVVRVEFYREGELLGVDANGSDGWSLIASTTDWVLGEHVLWARAQDNDGVRIAELSTTVMVQNAVPTIDPLLVRPDPVTRPDDLTLTFDRSYKGMTLRPRDAELTGGTRFFADPERLGFSQVGSAAAWTSAPVSPGSFDVEITYASGSLPRGGITGRIELTVGDDHYLLTIASAGTWVTTQILTIEDVPIDSSDDEISVRVLDRSAGVGTVLDLWSIDFFASNSVIPEAGEVVLKQTAHGSYWQYIPRSLQYPVSVMVAVHGTPGEDGALAAAEGYLRTFQHAARQQGVVLLAPAFDTPNFGGIAGPGGGYRGLFGRHISADGFVNEILAEYSTTFPTYDGKIYLVGHSAGGQFVSRYLVMHPDRVHRAVISAAGTFAIPDPDIPWADGMARLQREWLWEGDTEPQIIDIAPDAAGWLKGSQLPVTVVVGSLDDLPHIERAQHWVRDMHHFARQQGVESSVQFVLVDGVGHSGAQLAPTAVQHLFQRVSDPDGQVLRVEFYRGDELLGESDGTNGWTWSGDTTGWPLGEQTVFARAQDNDGAWSDEVSTTVMVLNTVPTIGALLASPDKVTRPDALTLTAEGVTDPDGSVVKVEFYRDAVSDDKRLGTVPANGSWILTGVSTAGWQLGEHTLLARALDNDGAWSVPVSTTVTVQNAPPTIAVIGNKSVNEGSLLTFTASATDADVPANTLTFSLDAGAPSGASIDANSGVFTWTPSEAQGPGTFNITVRVTDNGTPNLDDFEAIEVTVGEVNVAPILASIGNKSVNEGSQLTFTASATDADVPGNALTFSLDAGAPSGASIDANSGVFIWTPSEAQGPGTFNITVRVTDNGTPSLNDFETIEVPVAEVNVAPILASIGNKSVNEGSLLTFTTNATDADVPANTLTFSLGTSAPSGASIDANSGVFTWTPSETQGPGTFNITVRVTDNGTPSLNDFETIEVTVGVVNAAPVLASIGNKSVNEGSLLTFTASATDADVPAHTLTFSLDASAPSGASIDVNSGVFTWTPSEAQGPGTFNITVRVTDNGAPNLDDIETIEVVVGEANLAPVLAAIDNRSVNEGSLLAFTASATDADTPANTLTFSLDAGFPTGASIDANSGVFTWTPSEAQGPGTFNITVRVTDNGTPNLNDFETIEVTVGEVNVAPVLASIGNKSVNEGNLLTFTASATDADTPANTLTFSLDAGFPTGASIDANNGVLTWTPSEAQGPGTFNITVRVTDNGTPSLNDFETVEVTVGEVNVAPVLASIGNKSVDEGRLLTFTASATDADVPANTLTFSLDAGFPIGASIDANSGVFTWTPSETQGPGPINIIVRVTDNGTPNLNDFETIEVTVGEVNVAPVLAGIGNKSVDEGSLLTFTASATDVDVPANTLTFSLDAGAPSGASIDANSGVFTWTPTEAQGPGTFNITVRVTDNGSPNLNDVETIEVTVGEVNVAPVLASIGNKSVDESNLLMFTASASDSDIPANTLTFSLDAGAPSGASIDANSGVFTWTPSEAQGPGIFNIAVRVTDNGPPNLNDVETIEVTVGEVNAAPVLASIGNKSVNEGSQLTFTASATDTDTPTNMLTFSLDAGAPSGASIDATSGVFTWTPSEPQGPGTFSITVRVTDNGTPKFNVMTTFSIEVADPHPWQNFVEPRDVNRDGSISPVDALIVINDLNSKGPRALVGLPLSDSFYIDVNGDGSVSPVDALVVINWLNEPLSSSEGEFIASEMIISGPIVQPRSKLLANPLSSERNATRLPLTTVEPVAVNETAAAGRPPLRLRPFPNAKFFASCELDDLDIEGLLEMISEDIANAIHGG
jgi:pimeloyl-ACP methyl ester carboxylesterase